jgi:hypothetical protein
MSLLSWHQALCVDFWPARPITREDVNRLRGYIPGFHRPRRVPLVSTSTTAQIDRRREECDVLFDWAWYEKDHTTVTAGPAYWSRIRGWFRRRSGG